MNFVHLSLLAGAAVVSIPIALHLFGQRQPKQIDFPSLRFIQQTASEKRSSWQLRHFLLLLLRVLLLAVLAFALARPRVHSAVLGNSIGIVLVGVCAVIASLVAAIAWGTKRTATVRVASVAIAIMLWLCVAGWTMLTMRGAPAVPGGDQKSPIVAAFVIHNGPSMEFRSAGSSRLDKAKEFGSWVLDQLPQESQVGILTGAPVGSLSLGPATAKNQIDMVRASGMQVDLLSRVRTAVDLVIANEFERKEVYVLTDLSNGSWQSPPDGLSKLLTEYRDEVLVQIIDLGDPGRSNWQLSDVALDQNAVSIGGRVAMEISVTRPEDSRDNTATVELIAEAADPTLPVLRDGLLRTAEKRVVDRQLVEFGSDRVAKLTLSAANLHAGTNNFWIRLDKQDPLLVDNERFVSVPTFSQQPTLVVASDRAITRLLTAMVDLDGETGRSIADQAQYVQLSDIELEKYAVVCLYDPPPLTTETVERLNRHAAGGGGLLLILGPQLLPASDNPDSPINALLPGKLAKTITRGAASAFLEPVAQTHPVFSEFDQWQSGNEIWNQYPIITNWTFVELAETARTIIQVSDNRDPALITHQLGRGQVMTLTTPLPEPDLRQRELWNFLWASDDPYSSFALLLGTFRVLSGADMQGAVFQAGQTIGLNNDSRQWPTRYTRYSPPAQQTPVIAAENQVIVGRVEVPGIHYLRGQKAGPVVRSFAVNTPQAATNLQRVTKEQIDEMLGNDNYRLASEKTDVESSIGMARFGRELFPLLITLVSGIFLAEQAMSNRFYSISLARKRGEK